MRYTPDELETCLKILQAAADDPAALDGHERFKALVAKVHRLGKKGARQAAQQLRTAADRDLARRTGLVRRQPEVQELPGPAGPARYHQPRPCYVCKTPFTAVHFFYHRLCPGCAALNWEKRHQRADLSGRVALVTGGRIKLGYQTALKLLRDGARVLVTTRFPHDAARRFAGEDDQALWHDRLALHGLDLRDLPAVEAFAHAILDREPHLDILVHNAAQTIKRPLAFYRHLLDAPPHALLPAAPATAILEARPGYKGLLPGTEAYFPPGAFDRDGQQIDRRPSNSWRLKLGEVGTVELLEALLVGSVAPFVLSNHLLPALLRSPHPQRFIVNVSAMEGQFARAAKTPFHPHTNMAKAALNMLTRTVAADLAERGVYVNSVDPGWFSDEKPLPAAERARGEQGFHPPVDLIDGAARLYDPIARGVNEPGEPPFGHYLKDYAPFPW